jgi:rubredoxin
MMKCKLCGHILNNEADGEYDEDLDYDVLETNENGLCRKCLLWYQTRKGNNSNSNAVSTIEYVLICLDCKYQTPIWISMVCNM